MKRNVLSILFILISCSAMAATEKIEVKKLTGPECTKYLKDRFKYKLAESYQICSLKTDEAKVCLIKNRKLSKDKLAKKCK